jgi:hypothetical protein
MEDEGGWVAANNPGNCTYTNLTEGDTYLYLETIIRCDHAINTMGGGDFVGHGFTPVGTGKTGHATGTEEMETITVIAEVTNDIAEKAEHFVKFNNRDSDGQKYLCLRFGASDWKKWPDSTPTAHASAKKYVPLYSVAIRGTFTGEKDRQQLQLECVPTW